MRAETVGVAMKVASTLSVDGRYDRAREIASRPARFAHRLPQEENRPLVEEADDDKARRDDARCLVAGTFSLALGNRLAVAAGDPSRRRNYGAHNSAVEQTAGSHSLAAAAHRGR